MISKQLIKQFPKYCTAGSVRILSTSVRLRTPGDAERKSSERIEECFNRLDLSFRNTQEAYRSKTNYELVRALFVLRMCDVRPLVHNNEAVLKAVRKLLGQRLFEWLMRASIYGHFVAGSTQQEIRPTVMRMRDYGVKSIMDYSVEKDTVEADEVIQEEELVEVDAQDALPLPKPVPAEDAKSLAASQLAESLERYKGYQPFWDRREGVVSARTYFYRGEPECDRNMEIFCDSARAVAQATDGTGFVAVKLTALGRPKLLATVSMVLERSRMFYKLLTGVPWNKILDVRLSRDDLLNRLQELGVQRDNDQVKEWFAQLDFDSDGFVDLFEWRRLLDHSLKLGQLFRILDIRTGTVQPLAPNVTAHEERQFANMIGRVNNIVETAMEHGVRVMIDAEQTYYQPAISRLVLEMMRKLVILGFERDRGNFNFYGTVLRYNGNGGIVFNTYQAYLRSALTDVQMDMQWARRENFHFGCKLVRGAYMQQERQRAQAIGYDDPINPDYQATSDMYHRVLLAILDEMSARPKGDVSIMCATHNEDTVRFGVRQMRARQINPDDRLVCFGQLYGMCDQVSFSLGQAGYSVYKYVPYGPVDEVLPYLSRRALENSTLMGSSGLERTLMWTEVKRRLAAGQWWYTPSPPPQSTVVV